MLPTPADSRLGKLCREQVFGNRLSWWQRDPLLTQPSCHKAKWALTHYLRVKIAALFNTAHLAGPRGTPRALGGRTALTLLKDICQGHPPQPQPDLGCPIQEHISLKPTERALYVPQDSHPRFKAVLPIPVWGFPIPEPGMSCRLWDRALQQALPLPRLDVNAKVKYNPPTQTRC